MCVQNRGMADAAEKFGEGLRVVRVEMERPADLRPHMTLGLGKECGL